MNRESASRNGKTTREAIQAAAIAIFARKGFEGTTTREICDQSGVTKPVLYYYFGCKEHLYEELIREALQEYREDLLKAAQSGRSTRDKLVAIGTAVFELTSQNPDRSRLVFHMMFAPRGCPVNVDCTENCGLGAEVVRKVLAEGVAKGEIRGNPEEITAALIGIQTYCVMDFLLTGRKKLDGALAARLVDLLLRGAEKRAGAASRSKSFKLKKVLL